MTPRHDPLSISSIRRLLRRATVGAAVIGALALAPSAAQGQSDDPDPTRFADAIETFMEWDAKNAFPQNGIVMVGSSSIRFWDTAQWLPDRPIINRGFGGSHTSDVNHYIDETVLKYEPDAVVFYAGDNDLNAGKTPEQVLEDIREFVALVEADLPDTDILFISVKPSLSRWDIWPEMQETNAMIADFVSSDPDLHLIDVGPAMLGSDGEPLLHLFISDGLHMTDDGYEIWAEIVGDALTSIGE